MGRELSGYVEGNAVSRHLLCSICHGVLESPVQTKCEHLFCEEELIEWLCHKTTCPVCNADIDPEDIVRAPRAIVGLIDDLCCYCDFAGQGCPWTGSSDSLDRHTARCEYAPRESLYEKLERKHRELEDSKRQLVEKDREITRLRKSVQTLEKSLDESKEDREAEMENTRRRVRFLERALESGEYADRDPRDHDRGQAEHRRSRHGRENRRSSDSSGRNDDRWMMDRRQARRNDPITDVTRIHSLRDSLETLRLHADHESPRLFGTGSGAGRNSAQSAR